MKPLIILETFKEEEEEQEQEGGRKSYESLNPLRNNAGFFF